MRMPKVWATHIRNGKWMAERQRRAVTGGGATRRPVVLEWRAPQGKQKGANRRKVSRGQVLQGLVGHRTELRFYSGEKGRKKVIWFNLYLLLLLI